MKRSSLLGGVFLFKKENTKLPDLRFLLAAGAAWLAAACILLLAAASAASIFELGERGLGYLSSAVSFLAAVMAGMFASRKMRMSGLFASLLTATVLVIALLTAGFLAEGEKMDPSAVLSIVSFTYAGVIFGVLLRPTKKPSGRKRRTRN